MSRETAEKIRAALANCGWGRAAVSVRNQSYSMGSTVHVTIKRAEIPLGKVNTVASSHESIDRDESGEILGGGNTFVSVEYADGVLVAHIEKARHQFELGRRRWGTFELSECDRFTWDIFRFEAGCVGRFVTKADHTAPGAALVRVLAAAGELALLDQSEAGNGAPPAGTPANDAAPAHVVHRIAAWDRVREAPICGALVAEARERTIFGEAVTCPDCLARGGGEVPAAPEPPLDPAFVARNQEALARARVADPHSPLPGFGARSMPAPPFALADATEAESSTVRGALLVLTAAVENGSMPAHAALEAIAHLAYRIGRDSC